MAARKRGGGLMRLAWSWISAAWSLNECPMTVWVARHMFFKQEQQNIDYFASLSDDEDDDNDSILDDDDMDDDGDGIPDWADKDRDSDGDGLADVGKS